MRFTILFIFIIITKGLFAQEEVSKPKSAYDKFLSDQGTMITKDFTQLNNLQSAYQNLEVKAVKLTSNKGVKHFLSITGKSKYSDKSAIIVKEDLIEVNKALTSIIEKSKKEANLNLEYREHYFVTNDGFKVGYYQKGTEQTFFINLDDYQNDDTYFFDSFQPLISTINSALTKMQ